MIYAIEFYCENEFLVDSLQFTAESKKEAFKIALHTIKHYDLKPYAFGRVVEIVPTMYSFRFNPDKKITGRVRG